MSDAKRHLYTECIIYDNLKHNRKFATKYGYGYYKTWRYLVMEKLGSSLKQKFYDSEYNFDLNTVANIAVQLLYRIQDLHNIGWLHQDIKPFLPRLWA